MHKLSRKSINGERCSLELIARCLNDMQELFNLYDSLKGKDHLNDLEDNVWCNILFAFEIIYRNLDREKNIFKQEFDFDKVIKE